MSTANEDRLLAAAEAIETNAAGMRDAMETLKTKVAEQDSKIRELSEGEEAGEDLSQEFRVLEEAISHMEKGGATLRGVVTGGGLPDPSAAPIPGAQEATDATLADQRDGVLASDSVLLGDRSQSKPGVVIGDSQTGEGDTASSDEVTGGTPAGNDPTKSRF